MCLICTENDPARLFPFREKKSLAGSLNTIDCFNRADQDKEFSDSTQYADISDTKEIQKCIRQLGKVRICCFECLSSSSLLHKPISICIDSLNSLEVFNSSTCIYRLLKLILDDTDTEGRAFLLPILMLWKLNGFYVDIILIHHSDVIPPQSSPHSSLLLQSLLSPTFSPSLLHLTLHTPSLLAYLYQAYNIQQIGQNASVDADAKLFDFLPLLHKRNWGNPLHLGVESKDTNYGEAKFGSYDIPSEGCVLLDFLGEEEHQAGRCVIEYASRGISKSSRKISSARPRRGLEGLKAKKATAGMTRLDTTLHVAGVLRIRSRSSYRLEGENSEEDKVARFLQLLVDQH